MIYFIFPLHSLFISAILLMQVSMMHQQQYPLRLGVTLDCVQPLGVCVCVYMCVFMYVCVRVSLCVSRACVCMSVCVCVTAVFSISPTFCFSISILICSYYFSQNNFLQYFFLLLLLHHFLFQLYFHVSFLSIFSSFCQLGSLHNLNTTVNVPHAYMRDGPFASSTDYCRFFSSLKEVWSLSSLLSHLSILFILFFVNW